MSIVVIFPLAASDRLHASAQLRLLEKFGPYPHDKALILPTPGASFDPLLQPVIEGIKKLFQPENTHYELTPNDFGGNWSFNSGSHFRTAMEILENLGWRETAVWLEPDVMMLVPNWLELIKNDYSTGGTPFRGMIEKTRWIRIERKKGPKGELIETGRSPKYDGSVHFVGAGMYPGGYLHYREPRSNSPMASFRSPSPMIPFDVKCQGQHLPATQSPLWLHKPRTVNWRRVNGDIFTCQDQNKDEFGLTYAGETNLSGIVMVHGVKDHSLADEILKAIDRPSSSAPKTAITEWGPPKTETMGPPPVVTVSSPPTTSLPEGWKEPEAPKTPSELNLQEQIHDLKLQNEAIRKELESQCETNIQMAKLIAQQRSFIEELQAPKPEQVPSTETSKPKATKPAKKPVKKKAA